MKYYINNNNNLQIYCSYYLITYHNEVEIRNKLENSYFTFILIYSHYKILNFISAITLFFLMGQKNLEHIFFVWNNII